MSGPVRPTGPAHRLAADYTTGKRRPRDEAIVMSGASGAVPVPVPSHLALGDVVGRLEEDPGRVVPVGFGGPHCYRGDYTEVTFEIRGNVTIGSMLAAARSALGAAFKGWSGGEHKMRAGHRRLLRPRRRRHHAPPAHPRSLDPLPMGHAAGTTTIIDKTRCTA